MTPAKRRGPMNARERRGFAHTQSVNQRLAIGQPSVSTPQMRQRRSGQGIEGLVAGTATVALDSAVLAPQQYLARVAMRTRAHFFGASINETFRASFWCDLVKHRFDLFALTNRQPAYPLEPISEGLRFHLVLLSPPQRR